MKSINAIMSFFFLFFFLFNGCKDEATSPFPQKNIIQPLAVGNEWSFADSIFSNNGITTGITTIKITKWLNFYHNDVFDWQVYGDGSLLRTNYVNTDEYGLWHYGETTNNETLILRKLWARYPAAIGDSFIEPRYSYGTGNSDPAHYEYTDTWKWVMTSRDFEIRLANGQKLKCIAYTTTDKSGAVTNILYAENIGYAGWITSVNNKVVFKETLSSYILK